jgi:hypothetical protein
MVRQTVQFLVITMCNSLRAPPTVLNLIPSVPSAHSAMSSRIPTTLGIVFPGRAAGCALFGAVAGAGAGAGP